MLRRSQTAASQAQMLTRQRMKGGTERPPLKLAFQNVDEDTQTILSKNLFREQYGYSGRDKQIESAVDAINGRTVFLLAGTGFGKSRIPELVYHMHDERFSPIVLSMNPLDSLGDDQVLEKYLVNLKAINMTGENCTQSACDAVLKGEYNFIYVSPEVALTNSIFGKMFFDRRFQARLILKVVDEAHMIYMWGLVKSGQAKRMSSCVRVQDTGVFRPHYGELARQFLATDKVPLILMSATCTPQAIHAILANLKINPSNIIFHRAELVRPELRLIRRSFKRPMKLSLQGIFAHHTIVPTEKIPPSLIYAGTQNATLEYMRIVNSARGQPSESRNGSSNFIRRFHATTGPRAKLSAVEAYIAGHLAVLCCTLALGLGQNWHRVRRVIVVGRHNPCNFIQMAGRCGRDGRRGLAILLVEGTRTGGKNRVEDFTSPTIMTDDDRMDALAITMVCLRIALAVDLKYGYIPLNPDDCVVHEEESRQLSAGMPPCDCSNCLPEEAEALWLAQRALTVDNFDEALKSSELDLIELADDLPERPLDPEVEQQPIILRCSANNPIRSCKALEALVSKWVEVFHTLFYNVYPKGSFIGPWDYFSQDLAWDLAKNIDLIHQPNDLILILSGETVSGQFNTLFLAFEAWKDDSGSNEALSNATEFRKSVKQNSPSFKPPMSIEGVELLKKREAEEKQAEKQAKLVKEELRRREKANAAAAKKLRIQKQAEERSKLAEARKKARETRLQVQGEERQRKLSKNQSKPSSSSQAEPSTGTRKRAATSLTQESDMKRVALTEDNQPLQNHHTQSKSPNESVIDPRLSQPGAC